MNELSAGPLLPVYPIQRIFSLVEVVAPASANLVSHLRVGQPLRNDVVRATGRELLERHPALRHGFLRSRGEVWQREGALDSAVESLEIVRTPPGDMEFSHERFRLKTGPFLRLAMSDDAVGTVGVATNHIVGDRWSLWLLRRDFYAVYHSLLAGEPPPPQPTRRYGSFVVEDVEAYEAGAFEEVFDYWRSEMAGIGGVDALAVTGHTQRGAVYEALELRLTASDLEAIDAPLRRMRTTQFAAVCVRLARAIARACQQPDVVLIASAANRPRRSSWDVVGCFANATPLRFRFDAKHASADELARNVTRSLQQGRVPFEWLLPALPDRDRAPLLPNGPTLTMYVRSDGSFDDGARSPHEHRDVTSVPAAFTWGLDLDLMFDLNVRSMASIRVTFRRERVEPDLVLAILLILAEGLDEERKPSKVGEPPP